MDRPGSNTTAPAKEWQPEALRWPCLVLFAVSDTTIVVAIIALAVKSVRNNGFATVPDQQLSDDSDKPTIGFPNISWDLAILWTVLPSAVLQLLNIYWAWIAGSLASRQPYVDLKSRDGAAAASSILLDYRCTPVPWRWVRAFRLGHATVGFTALTGLALQYVAAPLGARLFATRLVMMPEDTPVSFGSAYNWSGITADFDWRPALSSARAALVHNENRRPWTNDEFAFRPFSAAAPRTGTYHVVANTTAYAAYVNCEAVADYAMSIEFLEPGLGHVEVSGTDRGCEVSHGFAVMEGAGLFLKTSAKQDCPAVAHYSRIFFTAGAYSPSSPYLLSNVSIISCATDYQEVPGLLEVAFSSSSPSSGAPGAPAPPVIRAFTPLTAGPPPSGRGDTNWPVVELGMLNTVVFNPSKPWSTSEFGTNVLYLAETHPSASAEGPLAPAALADAIARVFGATYAVAVATAGFAPLEAAEVRERGGTLWTPATRLFVVEWAAYVILALLLVALVLTGWVFWHVLSTSSILTEEPEGLLAMAGLLDGSDLMAMVPWIRQLPGYDGRVRKMGKRLAEVVDNAWVAEEDGKGLVGGWKVKRKAD